MKAKIDGVVVNARFLSQQMTGVQRFAEQISLELKRICPRVHFVAPQELLKTEAVDKLAPTSIGRMTGHAWEQIELPRYLRSMDSPLLINLCNTGPVFYENQISTHHDIAYVRHPASFSRQFRWAYRSIAPLLLRNSRALVTVSEFSKREICEHYRYPAERAFVAPNAVGEFFSRREVVRDEKPYLLAVSSPSLHKNFVRVVEAYRAWPRKEEIRLIIVGSHAAVFAKQDFGDLPGGVTFCGRVSDDDLVSLYSGALGFVFPSLYEGFGIPPLEAQACGCPVIASNAAAIPETLGDSAYYFDPYNADAIMAAMDMLLCSAELREELIAKGFENVRRFSWKASACNVIEAIESLK